MGDAASAERGAAPRANFTFSPPRRGSLPRPTTPSHTPSKHTEPGSAGSRASSASRRRPRAGAPAEHREAAGKQLAGWARSPAGGDLERDGLPDAAALEEALQDKDVAGVWETLMSLTGPSRPSRLGAVVADFRMSVDRVQEQDVGRGGGGPELALLARRNELVHHLAELQVRTKLQKGAQAEGIQGARG